LRGSGRGKEPSGKRSPAWFRSA